MPTSEKSRTSPTIQRFSAVRRSWPKPTRGKVAWRLFRGWSDEQLRHQLAALIGVDRNFEAAQEEMTRENGWDQVHSHARIATEAAGDPEPDGPFEKAWTALLHYEFSDPRVVRAHFDPNAPLDGRRILLELQILGLHYLCPVYVAEVRNASDGPALVRGYRIDTLKGHIEAGSEWFLLEKDPQNGHVKFRIEAAWRLGEFPNLWSWAGFLLFARRYQRAWHRLAHLRMCELTTRTEIPANPVHGGLEHDELALPVASVHEVAGRQRWRKKAEEIENREEEEIAQAGLVGALERARGRTAAMGALAALAATGAWLLARRVQRRSH